MSDDNFFQLEICQWDKGVGWETFLTFHFSPVRVSLDWNSKTPTIAAEAEAEAETRAAAAERITVKTFFHKFINSRRFYFVSMPLKRCFQQISYFRTDSFFFFFFSLSVLVATTQLLSPYGLHFCFLKNISNALNICYLTREVKNGLKLFSIQSIVR